MKPDLDALIDLAGQHARTVLLQAKEQQIMPTWLIILPNGRPSIIGTPFRNQREKELILKKMRAHLKKVGAVAYSFVTETWYAVAPKGTDLTNLEGVTPPSQRLDRQEAVLAVAADFRSSKGKMWLIERDAAGQITGLTEQGPAHADMVGGFLGLLLRGEN